MGWRPRWAQQARRASRGFLAVHGSGSVRDFPCGFSVQMPGPGWLRAAAPAAGMGVVFNFAGVGVCACVRLVGVRG